MYGYCSSPYSDGRYVPVNADRSGLMDHGSWITRGAQRSPIATRFEFTPFLFLGLSYVYFFPVVSSWVAPECHHMWVVGCPESCTNDDRRGDAHSLVNRRVEEHMALAGCSQTGYRTQYGVLLPTPSVRCSSCVLRRGAGEICVSLQYYRVPIQSTTTLSAYCVKVPSGSYRFGGNISR